MLNRKAIIVPNRLYKLWSIDMLISCGCAQCTCVRSALKVDKYLIVTIVDPKGRDKLEYDSYDFVYIYFRDTDINKHDLKFRPVANRFSFKLKNLLLASHAVDNTMDNERKIICIARKNLDIMEGKILDIS